MNILRLAVVVAAVGIAGPASAEPLSLAFDNGRVTLRATGVPLRLILQEWSRLGQTRVVGLEKLAGAPVTIELTDMPERQALEVLLRSIAGYVAAPRLAAAAPTASTFDRLLLLPTSVAPPAPARAAARPAAFAPPPPPQPQPQAFPDPIQLANGESEPPEAQQPETVPIFSPTPDAVAPAAPAGPFGPGQLRPPQGPGDPNLTPAAIENQQQLQGPLTSPRPGILPVPKPQPPRP
jgi:hypothetical protein